MGWPFCPDCHATLAVESSGNIRCGCCKYQSNLSNMRANELPTSTTTSADTVIPFWAKSDEEQKALKSSSGPSRATVEEPCIKCGCPEVGFYCLQLRSVDEGQTVFYECPECRHTWSINN